MAEHDSDREDREPEEKGVPFDEEAAWAAIVAAYGEEPPDPPGVKPFKPIKDLALPESGTNDNDSEGGSRADDSKDNSRDDSKDNSKDNSRGDSKDDSRDDSNDNSKEEKPAKPLGSSISFAPGVGPRDYSVVEPSEDDFDDDDEGHFVPPEPPPLPAADTTAKFAWLAVLGGPILLLLAVLLGWEMTWWLATIGIGGFLGGFATLVIRMKTDDEDDDPGRGAVV